MDETTAPAWATYRDRPSDAAFDHAAVLIANAMYDLAEREQVADETGANG